MYNVVFYEHEREKCPRVEFLDELQTKVRAKVAK
jgi:hypothetical protein